MAGHVVVPEPSRAGRRLRSGWTYGGTGAFPCSGAGKELFDTWLLWISPKTGGGSWSHEIRGGVLLHALFPVLT
jgi:hypothetical protein